MNDDRPTVVVVDDSASVRLFFEKSTMGLDLELLTFASADESLSLLETMQPTLLFIDILMPDKDGLTFLQELRKMPSHADTKVVVISSKDYAQDKMTAKELGALDFVTKPMGTRTIQEIIEKYTGT